jgi:CubicO group peptidase (beta-lactamase class C family)
LKTLIKWAALALVVCAVLVIAHEPLSWQRYFLVAATRGLALVNRGTADLPTSFYEPKEVVSGGNQPAAPHESAAVQALDPASFQEAADYAGARNSRALIVTRHGYTVFEKYWQGTNFDTVVDSQGLGRVLAALATGIAISEKKIGWPDEPIGYLIPELAADPRGKITVRNLLQLSSGLPPSAPGAVFGTDIAGEAMRLPLVAVPGQQWADKSSDPDLLAYVIEKATKQRYAQYVSQSIWRRIGAADASMWLDRAGGNAHVDRGFLVRQGDWMRVAELLLQNGNYQGDEVVVPRWVTQMLQPARSNSNYGAFVHLGAHAAPGMTPYATPDMFVVEGGGNRLWLVPSMQIAVLRTGATIGSDWDDGRIPNLIVRGAHDYVPPAARPGADLRQLVPNH